MINLVQKRIELMRGIEILTAETSDLLKRKKELERINVDLDIKTNQKMMQLKELSDGIKTLNEQITKVKADLQDYRRQEIQSTADEVEKMRIQGDITVRYGKTKPS